MNRLLRELAPISDAAWTEIDREASRSLKNFLAARKVLDFTGPLGWDLAAVSTGRSDPAAAPSGSAVRARRRRALELVEFRSPFTLAREELDAIERGACDADLSAVVDAARQSAFAEDQAVFHGTADDSITGITELSPHDAIDIGDDFNAYPTLVAGAVAGLQDSGVGGPYALALGSTCYRGVIETTEHGGYPLLEHLRTILGGPVIWARAVNGAIVLSQRGDDFEFVSGGDLAIGYAGHDGTQVELYLEESFTVRITSPEAAVALVHS
jgi:uncharacterized linocin/CFP29 family protein